MILTTARPTHHPYDHRPPNPSPLLSPLPHPRRHPYYLRPPPTSHPYYPHPQPYPYYPPPLPLVAVLFTNLLLCHSADAGCDTCRACTQRFGCLTYAWGRCCSLFYMHNGRKKRSQPPPASFSPYDDAVSSSIHTLLRVYRSRNKVRVRASISNNTYTNTHIHTHIYIYIKIL